MDRRRLITSLLATAALSTGLARTTLAAAGRTDGKFIVDIRQLGDPDLWRCIEPGVWRYAGDLYVGPGVVAVIDENTTAQCARLTIESGQVRWGWRRALCVMGDNDASYMRAEPVSFEFNGGPSRR